MSPQSESQSYEIMLNRVESIIGEFGDPKLSLDDMISHVEEAYLLIGKMRSRLDDSKNKVEELRTQFEEQLNQ